jgi:tetratricopeptide (TPR) repeat protein
MMGRLVEGTHIPTWIVAFLMMLWQAVAAHAGPLEDCDQVDDLDRRIRGCTDRIRQFPSDATAFFNRGFAYLSKGDLNLAIADHTNVVQIDPGFAAAYYHRGIAYEISGRYDPAIADFGKTVEVNPRHGEAFDARARIYLKTDQRTLALRDAERAVSIDRFNAKFLNTRAQVYEALGQTKAAIADYQRVLSQDPSIKSAIDGLKRLGASSSKLSASAQSFAKDQGGVNSYRPGAQPRNSQEEIECERARHADPAGYYGRYPCWARAAFSNRRR